MPGADAWTSGTWTLPEELAQLLSGRLSLQVANANAATKDAHANVFTAAAALAFATGSIQMK